MHSLKIISWKFREKRGRETIMKPRQLAQAVMFLTGVWEV
jgi:hypothetical protein